MSKELEALKRLYKHSNYGFGKHSPDEDYELVETALKRLEELEIVNSEQFKEKCVQDNLAMTFELNVANKKLKAFEIIKEKNVDVAWLKCPTTIEDYNDALFSNQKELTAEEFAFLKEVLK